MTSAQSHDPADAAPQPPRPRRPWRRRGLIALIGLLALGAAHPWWLPLALETAGPALARSLAGVELELEAVERADLGGLDVRGLVLSGGERAPTLERLAARRLSCTFGLGLLRGDLGALQTLDAEGLRVELQGEHAGGEVDDPAESSGVSLPEHLPRVDLRDVELRWRGTGNEFAWTEGRLTLTEVGALRASGRIQDRRVDVTGRWREHGLRQLEAAVEGEPLLADSRVDLARLDAGEVTAELALRLGESRGRLGLELAPGDLRWELELAELDLARDWPAALAPDLARPAGRVELRSSGRLDPGDPIGAEARLEVEGEGLRVAGWELESWKGRAGLSGALLSVDAWSLRQSEANRLLLRHAELPLRGTDATNWLDRATAELEVELRDLAALLEPAGLLDVEGPELVEHELLLSAEVSVGRLRVREGRVLSEAGTVELERGEAWIAELEDGERRLALALHGAADVPSLADFGALLGRRGWAGSAAGRVDLSGTWPRIAGELRLAGSELTLEGLELGAFELVATSGERPGRVEVPRLYSESAGFQLDASGAIELGGETTAIEVARLAVAGAEGGLQLREAARIELRAEGGHVSRLELAGEAGELDFEAAWSADQLDLALDLRSLRPAVLLEHTPAGWPRLADADGQLRATYDGASLRFESSGALRGLDWREFRGVDVVWQAQHDGAHLKIARLEARGTDGLAASCSGELPLLLMPELVWGAESLTLQLDGGLPLNVLPGGWSGELQASGELSGTWRELRGTLELDGRDLELPPEQRPEGLGPGRLAGRVELTDGLRCEGLELGFGELFSAVLDGRLDLPLDLPRWIAEPRETAAEGEVQGSLRLTTVDLERLAPVLAAYDEAFAVLRAGTLGGVVELDGPLLEPRLGGELAFEGGRLRLGGGLPRVEGLAGGLRLAGRELVVDELRGTLGSAPFELRGSASFDGEEPRLELELAGENLLLFRRPDANVRADTELAITGPLSALEVGGSLRLTRGHYAPDTRFFDLRPNAPSSGVRGFQLFSLRDAPLRDVRFDVRLDSASPFQIQNTVVRGSMRPRLHLGGTGLVPVLTGSVFLDRTLVNLPASRLEITGGTVSFLEENPFVPEVDVVGQTRMLGYDIRAQISGDYDDAEVLFSSTPPLSQEDLFLLVVTGRLPEDPDRNDALSTANTVALYLARDTLSRWFSDDGPIDEDALLERLEFAFGQDVSKNGTETVDVAFRLTDKEGLPPDRRNARHLFLAGQRDKYEDYNYGLRLVFRFRR